MTPYNNNVSHNGQQVLKQILDKKFSEVHFDNLEQLLQKRFYLFRCQIFCKFDLDSIPNDILMGLKLQNNYIYYEEVKEKCLEDCQIENFNSQPDYNPRREV